MAEAIASVVVEHVVSILEHQFLEQVNLVRGTGKKILGLSEDLKTIRNVLDDAEKKGAAGDEAVGSWLKKLENASYELDDVLDEWYTALRKLQIQQDQKYNVCNYSSFISIPSCFHKLAVKHSIAMKIKHVKENIDPILAEKDRFGLVPTTTPHSHDWRVQSTPFVDLAEIYGRDIERDDLVRRVISAMTQAGDQTNNLQILSVVGVGGVGKTTLAQLVYNNSQVSEYFELRIWICVSDPFDEVRVAKNIIEIVTGKSPDSNQLGFLQGLLKESVSGKKFLLVMDDVWTHDSSKWEPLIITLKNGSIGSKVLVTTRNEMVATKMGSLKDGIHHLGVLSDENCWLLLQRIALFGRDGGERKKFEGVGIKIANKCKGLPLAAKALGSLLYFKNNLEEWKNVLKSKIWELEGPKGEIFPHLHLSYNELSPTLKRCFLYCAIFPKDTRMDVEKLIEHWMAVGYLGFDRSGSGDMEHRGQEYFDNLAMRSLFQDFEKNYFDGRIKYCKMHDMVHDFARWLKKNGDASVEIKNTSICETCSPLLVSCAKEYSSIFFGNGELHGLPCDCVANLRVVSLRQFGKPRIGHEIKRFIHLRWMDLSGNGLASKDMETICGLYNLQTLLLKGCNLKEITKDIGNLIHLRHLNLSGNKSLKELPESICNLNELQRLNIDCCWDICSLPQGFHRLVNLKHLHYSDTSVKQFPQGLAQLINLRTLTEFHVGNGWSKLGWLKNMNCLSGSLILHVSLFGSESIVEDVREGELRKKDCIQSLVIKFYSGPVRKEDWEWVSLLDGLEPHPNLVKLQICFYGGYKLPSWVISPLNQLKFIRLDGFRQLSSLPPLGRLPCLEGIKIYGLQKMEVVGPEFLGTTTEGSNGSCIVFPKLKSLAFSSCDNWRDWEDITTEEHSRETVTVMPRLKKLIITKCKSLKALPHRLLRKVASSSSSLEKLDVSGSAMLVTRYRKSISEVCPHLRQAIFFRAANIYHES